MFIEVLSGVAAGFAVAAGVSAGLRWIRRRRQRKLLGEVFDSLVRFADEIGDLTRTIDNEMTDGIGWHGYAIHPVPIKKQLRRLEAIPAELEVLRARARGVATDGPLDRLREDLEVLASTTREMTSHYVAGIWRTYRDNDGRAVEWSATGREFTPTLPADVLVRSYELRREAAMLFRGSAVLAGRPPDRDEPFADWPIKRLEALPGHHRDEVHVDRHQLLG